MLSPTVKSIDLIGSVVESYLKARPSRARTPGFHVSSSREFCPREEFFLRQNIKLAEEGHKEAAELVRQAEKSKRLPAQIQGVVDTGTMMHMQYQHYVGVTGMARGRWQCNNCGFVMEPKDGKMPVISVKDATGFPIKDAAPCDICDGDNLKKFPPWLHVETEVKGPHGIVGHVDAVIHHKSGKIFIYDFKTINSFAFAETYKKLPKPENVYQLQIYVGLLRKKWPNVAGGVLGYIDKSTAPPAGLKEFFLEYDPRPLQETIAKAKIMEEAIKIGKVPPTSSRFCESVKCKRAGKCAFMTQCFNSYGQ